MHLRAKTGEDFGANSGFKSARMAKLWQFSQGHPKPTFSEKVQRGDQGKFFKNCPKSSLRLKGPKALSKSARTAKLWQFLQGHPKPAFSVKVQRGGPRKSFKNRRKNSPRLKGPKAHWRKWHYPLICTHLKCKHSRTFWRKQRLQKCQNGQVMAIFARSFKTRIFCKSAKGGTKEKF